MNETTELDRLKQAGVTLNQEGDDVFNKITNRDKVMIWIDEYVTTEDFMNKVRRYARLEIDSVMLNYLIKFVGAVLGAAIVTIVTFWVTGVFGTK